MNYLKIRFNQGGDAFFQLETDAPTLQSLQQNLSKAMVAVNEELKRLESLKDQRVYQPPTEDTFFRKLREKAKQEEEQRKKEQNPCRHGWAQLPGTIPLSQRYGK